MLKKELLVGLLFLGSLFLLGYVTIMIKGFSTGGDTFALSVEFDNVAGLRQGDQVRVRGFTVGEVTDLTYLIETNSIDVGLRLNQKIVPRQECQFVVRSSSALGGTFVDYIPGTGTEASTEKLKGESRDLLAEIEKLVNDNRDSVRQIIANLERLSEQATDGQGLLRTLLNDAAVADEFRTAISDVSAVVKEISDAVGNDNSILGALLRDEEMTGSARDAFANVKVISEDLRIVMAEIREGKGAIGKLIMDPDTGESARSLISNLETASQNFNDLMNEMRTGKGIVAKILNDEEWANKFFGTLSNIEEVALKVNAGDGTIAQLLNDPALIQEAQDLLILLRESVEDQREQAPLNSFVNTLFLAF